MSVFANRNFTRMAIVGLCAAPFSATAAPPEDWSQIPTQTIKLFYPGTSSYQWLRAPAHNIGNVMVAQGQSCTMCHNGAEETLGNSIVDGGALEPNPIDGKNGVEGNFRLTVACNEYR